MERTGALLWGVDDVTRLCGASAVRLSLDEVREIGKTAFFFDFGEALMYLDGELFDIRDRRAVLPSGALPKLPPEVLESGVGIEYGWRHTRGCACHLCAAWAGTIEVRPAERGHNEETHWPLLAPSADRTSVVGVVRRPL